MPELILASTSPYRRRLLADAGVVARAEAPGVDERAQRADDPVALACALARSKAIAVWERWPDALVLGADQVAYYPEEPSRHFGKPADRDDHLARLRGMIGRRHALVTGVALVGRGVEQVEHEVTTLVARADVEDDEIVAYVDSGEGAGCAGGYAAEGRGAFLFERIEGDWSNVIGLPIPRVLGLLRARGWRFPRGFGP